MAKPGKSDPTLWIILGLIAVVVVGGSFLPSCGSDDVADATDSSTGGSNSGGGGGGSGLARAPASIWLSRQGDPYAGKPLRKIDSNRLNAFITSGTELAIGTDGANLNIIAFCFDGQMDQLATTAPADQLWLNDSLDFFFGDASHRVVRFTVDSSGAHTLQIYAKPDLSRDRVGLDSPLSAATRVDVRRETYGWEAHIVLPVADLGISRLTDGQTLPLQVHRNRRGLTGQIDVQIAPNADTDPSANLLASLQDVQIVDVLPPKKDLRTDVPRTATAYISFVSDISAQGPIALPDLRVHTGDPFTQENTEIRIATDGQALRIDAYCHDASPQDMVTAYSSPESYLPFKDDSVEFFILPGDDSPYYYQVIASNTGATQYYRGKNVAQTMILRPWQPTDTTLQVTKHDSGFSVHLLIPVAELGIAPPLEPGDSLRLQMVRNYRGQHLPGSTLLQLHPTYIYSQIGTTDNHGQDGLVTAQIIDPADLQR